MEVMTSHFFKILEIKQLPKMCDLAQIFRVLACLAHGEEPVIFWCIFLGRGSF